MNTSIHSTAQSEAAAKPLAKATRSSKKAIKQVKTAAVDAKRNAIEGAEALADVAVEQTRASAEHVATSGKNQTEELIRALSRAIDAGCSSLEQDGMNKTASYARIAADGLGKAANEVDKVDIQHLTGKAEGVVRNNPMLTFGALALAGFAVASAIKNNRKS